eukprot:gene14266-16840_t
MICKRDHVSGLKFGQVPRQKPKESVVARGIFRPSTQGDDVPSVREEKDTIDGSKGDVSAGFTDAPDNYTITGFVYQDLNNDLRYNHKLEQMIQVNGVLTRGEFNEEAMEFITRIDDSPLLLDGLGKGVYSITPAPAISDITTDSSDSTLTIHGQYFESVTGLNANDHAGVKGKINISSNGMDALNNSMIIVDLASSKLNPSSFLISSPTYFIDFALFYNATGSGSSGGSQEKNVTYIFFLIKAYKGVNNTMWITGFGFPQESLLVLDKSSARIKPLFLDDNSIQFPLGQIDLGNSTHTIQVVTESGWGSNILTSNFENIPVGPPPTPTIANVSQSETRGFNHNLMPISTKFWSQHIDDLCGKGNVVVDGQDFGSDPSVISVSLCNETITDFTLTSHQQIHFSIPPLVKNTCPLKIQVSNQSTIYEKSVIPPIIMSTSNISVDGGHFLLQGIYFNDPVQVAIGSNICFNLTMTRKGTLQEISCYFNPFVMRDNLVKEGEITGPSDHQLIVSSMGVEATPYPIVLEPSTVAVVLVVQYGLKRAAEAHAIAIAQEKELARKTRPRPETAYPRSISLLRGNWMNMVDAKWNDVNSRVRFNTVSKPAPVQDDPEKACGSKSVVENSHSSPGLEAVKRVALDFKKSVINTGSYVSSYKGRFKTLVSKTTTVYQAKCDHPIPLVDLCYTMLSMTPETEVEHMFYESFQGERTIIQAPKDKFIEILDIDSWEMIGFGAQGLIYKGILDGVEVCVKQLIVKDQEYDTQRHSEENFLEELSLYFLDVVLKNHIVSMLPSIPEIMMTLVNGMIHLNSALVNQIVHRDLKPPNIFVGVDDNNKVIIAIGDLGISAARVATQSLDALTRAVTPNIAPPEALDKSPQYSATFDAYSCGNLITGIMPFDGFSSEQYSILIRNNMRAMLPPDTPQEYIELLKKLWHQDPKMRPSFEEMAEWISQLPLLMVNPNYSELMDIMKDVYKKQYDQHYKLLKSKAPGLDLDMVIETLCANIDDLKSKCIFKRMSSGIGQTDEVTVEDDSNMDIASGSNNNNNV